MLKRMEMSIGVLLENFPRAKSTTPVKTAAQYLCEWESELQPDKTVPQAVTAPITLL